MRGIGRPRSTRVGWEFSYRLFPVPQCSLQLDDPNSIAWITDHLSGTSDMNTAVLPLTRPVVRNGKAEARKARTSTKSRVAAPLRYYSYYYISPALAIIGSVLAISLLLYQAGWTVNAIRLRVLDPVGDASGPEWNGATTRSSMTRSIQALARRDGTGLLSASALSKRGLDMSSVRAGEAVMQEQSTYQNDGGSVLQPLVCTPCLYSSHQDRMLIFIHLPIPRFTTTPS